MTVYKAIACCLVFCLSIVSSVAQADALFNDPALDEFVSDLIDHTKERHYRLVSKQSAIHKWLIRDCMRDRGFQDEVTSDPERWSQTLYGKYAYCQDHHIPGVDPPCPSEEVVELSVNQSCHQLAADQLDWSHDIMRDARGAMPDRREIQSTDASAQAIEKQWSTCMETRGFQYATRIDMFASFGAAADKTETERSMLPDHDQVMKSAEHCFVQTEYTQRYGQLLAQRQSDYFVRREGVLEAALARYTRAENEADNLIEQYCKQDQAAIVLMYEQDALSSELICQ